MCACARARACARESGRRGWRGGGGGEVAVPRPRRSHGVEPGPQDRGGRGSHGACAHGATTSWRKLSADASMTSAPPAPGAHRRTVTHAHTAPRLSRRAPLRTVARFRSGPPTHSWSGPTPAKRTRDEDETRPCDGGASSALRVGGGASEDGARPTALSEADTGSAAGSPNSAACATGGRDRRPGERRARECLLEPNGLVGPSSSASS